MGQFAKGLKNTAFGLFVLFYYNQVLELPGTLAGLALMIALLFDAATDPLAGSHSDNWKSRLGRRHPFMYASAVPLALAFVGLLWPPGNVETLGEWGLFAWLTLFAILTRGAMTLYHVPQLGARRRDDGELQRTQRHCRVSAVLRGHRRGGGVHHRAGLLLRRSARRAHRGGELRPETLASLDAASAWPKRAR